MRKNRWILVLLILTMVFSGLSVFADDAEDGYVEGTKLGKAEGRARGASDGEFGNYNMSSVLNDRLNFHKGKQVDEGKSTSYIDRFTEGYREFFESSYDSAYKDFKEPDTEDSLNIIGADEFGTKIGRIDGHIAYQSNRKNDWKKSLPSDREIVNMFELKRESREYEDAFLEIFKDAYKKSFEKAFQDSKLGEVRYAFGDGLRDGEGYAKDLATLNGKKDYLLGLSKDYTRDMPSNKEISDKFNLKNDLEGYEKAFLSGFDVGQNGQGYMFYYNDAYRKANKDFVEIPDSGGQAGGSEIGGMKGDYAAIIDITLQKPNDWTTHKIKDSDIIDEYGLSFQSEKYRAAFMVGYWDSFMRNYNETYKDMQQDTNKVKTTTEKVGIDGGNVGDDKFSVYIEAGTYYGDVIVTIDTIPTSHVNPTSKRHTKASEVYGLKIMNLAGTFDENKEITIGFKSFGNNIKYGIYKYHYNKWVYIPSVQDGDYLTANININNINKDGNIYAVRVDNEFPIFNEIRGHWGKDEITTYVKREVILGYPDVTFRPNREISRGEFVTMLSRLYDWYPPYDSTNVSRFKDYKEFGYAEKAISYATYYKIVGGYPDGTFRPHNPISYREVEIVMSRVLGGKAFKWDKYAEQLIYEKRYRSKSKESMNNKITRAEFTFLLHHLNEWQY